MHGEIVSHTSTAHGGAGSSSILSKGKHEEIVNWQIGISLARDLVWAFPGAPFLAAGITLIEAYLMPKPDYGIDPWNELYKAIAFLAKEHKYETLKDKFNAVQEWRDKTSEEFDQMRDNVNLQYNKIAGHVFVRAGETKDNSGVFAEIKDNLSKLNDVIGALATDADLVFGEPEKPIYVSKNAYDLAIRKFDLLICAMTLYLVCRKLAVELWAFVESYELINSSEAFIERPTMAAMELINLKADKKRFQERLNFIKKNIINRRMNSIQIIHDDIEIHGSELKMTQGMGNSASFRKPDRFRFDHQIAHFRFANPYQYALRQVITKGQFKFLIESKKIKELGHGFRDIRGGDSCFNAIETFGTERWYGSTFVDRAEDDSPHRHLVLHDLSFRIFDITWYHRNALRDQDYKAYRPIKQKETEELLEQCLKPTQEWDKHIDEWKDRLYPPIPATAVVIDWAKSEALSKPDTRYVRYGISYRNVIGNRSSETVQQPQDTGIRWTEWVKIQGKNPTLTDIPMPVDPTRISFILIYRQYGEEEGRKPAEKRLIQFPAKLKDSQAFPSSVEDKSYKEPPAGPSISSSGAVTSAFAEAHRSTAAGKSSSASPAP